MDSKRNITLLRDVILSLLCILTFKLSYAAENDSIRPLAKKNFVFLVPTALPGDLGLDLNNFWLESGYQRMINRTNALSLTIGFIVKSSETPRDLYTIHAKHTAGINLSVEHKLMIRKKLYYASNVFTQYTSTVREQVLFSPNGTKMEMPYVVGRSVLGFVPKVGFQYITKKHIYTDVACGIGIKYISSYSSGKQDLTQNLDVETVSNKFFDSGNKFSPRFLFQFRIGYNF